MFFENWKKKKEGIVESETEKKFQQYVLSLKTTHNDLLHYNGDFDACLNYQSRQTENVKANLGNYRDTIEHYFNMISIKPWLYFQMKEDVYKNYEIVAELMECAVSSFKTQASSFKRKERQQKIDEFENEIMDFTECSIKNYEKKYYAECEKELAETIEKADKELEKDSQPKTDTKKNVYKEKI